jgi:uncharacterized protein YjeT (DUF2065 family)
MFGDHLLAQILVSTVVVFLFVGSLLGLTLGLGLIARSAATLPFIVLMNQWVSTRQALKPLELPRQVAPTAFNARWFGAVLVALGTYAAIVLIGSFDVQRVAALFRVDARYSLAGLALDALKWFLVVGSLGAIVSGIMLLFFPRAWRSIESRANHWYSTRNLEQAGDTLYMSLDRIVEAFPRASGLVILTMSLVAAIASGMLLFPSR